MQRGCESQQAWCVSDHKNLGTAKERKKEGSNEEIENVGNRPILTTWGDMMEDYQTSGLISSGSTNHRLGKCEYVVFLAEDAVPFLPKDHHCIIPKVGGQRWPRVVEGRAHGRCASSCRKLVETGGQALVSITNGLEDIPPCYVGRHGTPYRVAPVVACLCK